LVVRETKVLEQAVDLTAEVKLAPVVAMKGQVVAQQIYVQAPLFLIDLLSQLAVVELEVS
jgi:hypothetical protein